jgi:parvulin-like peptidyl-prolyl isomerase
MDKMRRRSLPPGHASVFELKPGDVSPVISDQTGQYVYKVESKEVETIKEAEPEISSTLRQQRLQNMMQQIEQPFTIDVNHAYFGAYKQKDDD